MKKIIALILSFVVAFAVMGADYNADTIGLANQSNQGNVKAKYFSYATSTTAHATNDTISLAILPPGARVIDGSISVTAMGGAQTLDLGLRGANGGSYIKGSTANDPDLFLDGISVSNAVQDTFANLVQNDSNANYELGANHVDLYITALGAAWTTNETISGVVYYIEP